MLGKYVRRFRSIEDKELYTYRGQRLSTLGKAKYIKVEYTRVVITKSKYIKRYSNSKYRVIYDLILS